MLRAYTEGWGEGKIRQAVVMAYLIYKRPDNLWVGYILVTKNV